MDETLARGLLMGLVFAVIGLVANVIWKIIRSPSEGARRFKIVSGIALFLLVASMMVAGMGVMGAVGTGIAIAAVIWVIKGFKVKTPSPQQQAAPQPAQPTWAEAEAAKPPPTKEMVPERKTIITCPNCGGKLRVLADKYIDVTCTHCHTKFRTHI